jgi:hypothetical protein
MLNQGRPPFLRQRFDTAVEAALVEWEKLTRRKKQTLKAFRCELDLRGWRRR